MTVWQERSPAQAAMLNPALLAVVAAAAAVQYERTASTAMVWPTTYLIAPLVLHRATRQALPRTTATHLAHWIHEHPVLHAGFSARAASLAEPVREGLRFGLAHGALRVDDQGRLSGTLATSTRSRASQTPTGPAAGRAAGPTAGGAGVRSEEVEQIVAKAGLVGRWLAKLEQPGTAFVMLGVAP